ncbi:hypothetical protein BHE74_00026761, partial [Ensete ventricosum]
ENGAHDGVQSQSALPTRPFIALQAQRERSRGKSWDLFAGLEEISPVGRRVRRELNGRGCTVLAGVDAVFDLGLGGGLVVVRSHQEGESLDAALGHPPRARGYPVDPSGAGESETCVTGIQQTYLHYHHDNVPRIFSPQLPVAVFVGRVLVGIPTILIVKFCSKAIAKWLLPIVCNTLGIPIVSSCYVPTLKGSDSKDKSDGKQSGYLQKLVAVFPHKAYDVDTGIRFLQYAGLAWSVVDLVPSLFSHLNL